MSDYQEASDRTRMYQCGCGSGQDREAEYDGYGIFMFYHCDRCYDRKRRQFRTDIFEHYECDEPIDDE